MRTVSRRSLLGLLGTGAFGQSTLRQDRDTGTDVFGAWLTGAKQLPPVETGAVGLAVFAAPLDGASIDYRLVAAGIQNVVESHVHKGPPDLDGNVVAYLFGPSKKPATKTGVLASGTLIDDDMIWPLTDVSETVDQMREENLYVNVHTTEHPTGEIRGQIRPLDG